MLLERESLNLVQGNSGLLGLGFSERASAERAVSVGLICAAARAHCEARDQDDPLGLRSPGS